MCWGLGQSAASRIFHRPGERDGAKGLVIVAEKWPWYTTLSWGGWSSEYPFSWRLYGEMYTIWQNCVKPQHICPYTSTPTFNIQPSPLNRTSVQAPICASTPPSLVALYVSVLCWSLCHSCLRRQARWVMQRGRGVFGRASPPGGRAMEN